MKLSLDNLVRFAALMCVAGLLTGYSSRYPSLQVIEILMLAVWLHQDYPHIKNFIEKNKKQ